MILFLIYTLLFNSRILTEIEKEKEEAEEEEIQYLEGLLAENYSDLTSGLGLQINQMLAKYKEKKAKLINRQKEVNNL